MSLKSREALKLAAASAVALSLLGAGSAQAATQNLQYSCNYPIIGAQPLQIAIDASIPASVTAGQATGAFAITATATAGGDTGAGIGLLGARSIEGSARATAALTAPGFSLPLGVPITIPKASIPLGNKANLVLPATGSTPSIKLPQAGYGSVDLGALALNLTARKVDGTAITQLSAEQTAAASDTDPATFDVACTLNSGQNARLANIAIADDTGAVPGTNPGTPTVNRLGTMTTTNTTVNRNYGITGAATLKTLITGSLPLTGGTTAAVGLQSGSFSGNLTLARTTGSLMALGFLPVVAKVDIVPTAPVTGVLANGVLNANAKVRIKLRQVTLAGLELAGGTSCQAKDISSINLKSTDKFFYPLEGGTLVGVFGISDLVNCGFLTGIVSPLTAGTGNAIALKLAPKA